MSVTSAYTGLDKLTPETFRRVGLFLRRIKDTKLDIIITETYRSPDRQRYLYAQGRTRPGKKVTWTLQSKHILGEAIDVAFTRLGKLSYSGNWPLLGQLGESCGLSWGGRWKTPDKPHFELDKNANMDYEFEKEEAKQFVIANGISNGQNGKDNLTREEMWVMFYRFKKSLK